METVIREYKDNDKENLIHLITFMQNSENVHEPEIIDKGENIPEQFLESMINEIKENDGKIYIAVTAGKVAGFVSGSLNKSPDAIELIDKKYFYISNIAVLPEFQGKGLGKKLLERIMNFAKSLDVKIIEISVLVKNEIAGSLYRKLGFRPYEYVYLKNLLE